MQVLWDLQPSVIVIAVLRSSISFLTSEASALLSS